MRRNYIPASIIEVKGVVSLGDGGTSATNAPDALVNLGLISKTQINIPYGLIPINETTGKIPEELLVNISAESIEVDGPVNLDVEGTATYQITNFDSRLSYYAEAESGSLTISTDKITYKAPMLSDDGGVFFVNGIRHLVKINPILRIPGTPTITFPVVDLEANVKKQLIIASDWFSDHLEDSVQSYNWQISKSPIFETLLQDVSLSTGSMNQYLLENITPGETFHVRVRVRGNYGYYSEWSYPRVIKRPVEQKPQKPNIITPSVDGDVNSKTLGFITTPFSGTAAGDTHLTSDIQLSTDIEFSNIIFESMEDSVNKTTFDITTPLRDINYYVRVRYHGALGWASDWSETRRIQFKPVEKPETPVITFPTVNGITGNTIVVVQATPFMGTAVDDIHEKTTWRFSKFPDFSVLLPISLVSTTDLLTTTVVIPEGVTIYIDVAYHGRSGWKSDASSARTILVDYPLKPSILSPINNAFGVEELPTFVSSALNMRSGNSYSSYKVEWELASDAAFINIVDTSGPKDIAINWTPSKINLGFVGHLRVRHISSINQVSPWSTPIIFVVREFNIASRIVAQTAANFLGEVAVSPNGKTVLIRNGTYANGYLFEKYDITSNTFTREGNVIVNLPTSLALDIKAKYLEKFPLETSSVLWKSGNGKDHSCLFSKDGSKFFISLVATQCGAGYTYPMTHTAIVLTLSTTTWEIIDAGTIIDSIGMETIIQDEQMFKYVGLLRSETHDFAVVYKNKDSNYKVKDYNLTEPTSFSDDSFLKYDIEVGSPITEINFLKRKDLSLVGGNVKYSFTRSNYTTVTKPNRYAEEVFESSPIVREIPNFDLGFVTVAGSSNLEKIVTTSSDNNMRLYIV